MIEPALDGMAGLEKLELKRRRILNSTHNNKPTPEECTDSVVFYREPECKVEPYDKSDPKVIEDAFRGIKLDFDVVGSGAAGTTGRSGIPNMSRPIFSVNTDRMVDGEMPKPAATGWQPIETAPIDTDLQVLTQDRGGNRHVYVASRHGEGAFSDWTPSWISGGDDRGLHLHGEPIAWMPLPDMSTYTGPLPESLTKTDTAGTVHQSFVDRLYAKLLKETPNETL